MLSKCTIEARYKCEEFSGWNNEDSFTLKVSMEKYNIPLMEY
jgi:hypothetical protein